MELSSLAVQVPPSGIREIVNLVLARPDADIVRLEIGEPDFPTPQHIADAAHEAVAKGFGYTQSFGIAPLRQAIAARLQRVCGLSYADDEIVVSQGAVQAIAAVFFTVLDPGDEVLVPDPAWPNYEMLAWLRGARPVRYPLRAAAGFLPDVDEIASLLSDRTKVIVLNSPSNPTGAVFPADTVRAIVELAAERDIFVLSDEVYDELIFEGPMANAAQYDRSHVIGVYSFSKTYSMTGWRVGYAACDRTLAERLGIVQEPLLSCISGVGQLAAVAALDGPQDCVTEMRDTYRRRRNLAHELFGQSGVDTVEPTGAFYQMVPLAPGVDSRLAALDLVEHGLATAPGTAFGETASDHLRLSLAASDDVITEGVGRLLDWAERTDWGRTA